MDNNGQQNIKIDKFPNYMQFSGNWWHGDGLNGFCVIIHMDGVL